MTTHQDGRVLLSTEQAAYTLGMTAGAFRAWARRHHVAAAEYRPTGTAGHPAAWWDHAHITAAVRAQHSSTTAGQASTHAAA